MTRRDGGREPDREGSPQLPMLRWPSSERWGGGRRRACRPCRRPSRRHRRGRGAITGAPQARASTGHDSEILLAGEEQRTAAAVMVANDLVGLPAQEGHRRAGERLQPRPLGPRADHHQPPAQAACKPSRHGRCACKGRAPRQRGKSLHGSDGSSPAGKLGIDGRRNHPAVAIVGGGDPLANGLGDRHEMRDAASGRAVPVSQTIKQQASHGSADRPIGPAFEVGVASLPGIAHRREAVADVGHAAAAARPTWRRSGSG